MPEGYKTRSVGHVHVLVEEGGACVDYCPHPDHEAVKELASAMRAAVKIRGGGPMRVVLEDLGGGCITLTPSEAEEAAEILVPLVAAGMAEAWEEGARRGHALYGESIGRVLEDNPYDGR